MSPYFQMCLRIQFYALAVSYLFAALGPMEAVGLLYALGVIP